MDKNLVFVISAPSGTGKTTIARRLKREIPSLSLIVTCTTKKPRLDEKEGVDYYFVSEKRFKGMIAGGFFLEWARVFGYYYGTPAEPVMGNIARGVPSLLTIDIQGGRSVKKALPETTTLIAVLPPSAGEQEKRIRGRNDLLDEEQINKRLDAYRHERSVLVREYDFVIINRDLDRAINRIKNIILKGRKY